MNSWHARVKRYRAWAIGAVLLLVGGLGYLIAVLPPLYNAPTPLEPARGTPAARVDARRDPAGHVRQARAEELHGRFDEAVAMLHAGQYEYAVAALHRVLELSPRMPEGHVNMGFALLGLRQHAAARDFFVGALALNPRQANAYYGLAEACEGLGLLPEAVGAMRAYLHLVPPDGPFVTKARAALWEWEALLARQGGAAEPADVAVGAGPAAQQVVGAAGHD